MLKAFKSDFDHFEKFINKGFCSLKVQNRLRELECLPELCCNMLKAFMLYIDAYGTLPGLIPRLFCNVLNAYTLCDIYDFGTE
jgi:hypothetical protein